MTSGRTWSAKDLDPQTRRMAEEAARLSGLSLEDWLRETVAQRAAEDIPRRPRDRSSRVADPEPGNIAATLARLGERIRSIAPQTRDVRDAAQKAELEEITARLARDLQDIDEAARSKIEGRERSEEPPPQAGLGDTLRDIEEQMAALARRTREESDARRETQYEEVRERIDALRRPQPPRSPRMPDLPRDLDATLREIEADIARAAPRRAPPAQPPPPEPVPSRSEMPRAAPRRPPEAKSLTAAIADIASRQSFLSGRTAPAEEATPAVIGALRAEVAVLSDRIAILNDRSSEERADREGATLRAEKAALAGQASMSTIAAMLGDIRTALVGLGARSPAPAAPADLHGLVAGMDDLRSKVDGIERNGRQGTESLRRLEVRVETIARVDPGALIKGVEDRLDRLAARIEVAVDMPLRDGPLDAVRGEIAALRRDLADRGGMDSEALETRMRELVDEIGATARLDDSRQLAALEARIERLAADLARTTPRAAALEAVEERLARLKDSVAEGRRDCVEAAQEAARKAVRDLAPPTDQGLVGQLRNDLDEVRRLIAASERGGALDEAAVKARLSAVASRIDGIAEAPAGSPAPTRDARAAEAVPPRARRDLGLVREVAASAPGEDRIAVDRRADFIAAARRAVHLAMAETGGSGMADDDMPALASAGAGGSPFARIGQAIRARRRPLLLAAAALVVAIGALQMFARPMASARLDGGAPGVVFVNGTVEEPVAQASSAAVAAVPDDGVAIPVATPAAPRQVGAIDPTVTGSTMPVLPELPAVGSDDLRAAALAGDPVAAYRIANLYADGRGTLRDLAQAAHWYQRAADAGMTPAIYRLASLYERGQGVPKDLGRAVALYRAAAERGNPGAMYNLAVLISAGAAGPPDPKAALGWFQAAAEHGVTDSQYNLGVLYARGIGVAADREAAYRWFAIAATAGDQDATGQRDQIAASLDPAQIRRADAAAAAFVPRTPPAGASDASVRAAPVAAGPSPAAPVAVADLPADGDGRRAMVRTVQALLAARGYDPGPPDGLEGPQTRQAVRAFQRSIGAPGTGRIDGALVVSLAPRTG